MPKGREVHVPTTHVRCAVGDRVQAFIDGRWHRGEVHDRLEHGGIVVCIQDVGDSQQKISLMPTPDLLWRHKRPKASIRKTRRPRPAKSAIRKAPPL